MPIDKLCESLTDPTSSISRVAGIGLFFTRDGQDTPSVVQQLLRRLHSLPEYTVFVRVRIVDVPFVSAYDKTASAIPADVVMEALGQGMYRMVISYGYAQTNVFAKEVSYAIVAELARLELQPNKLSLLQDLLQHTIPPRFQELLDEHQQTNNQQPDQLIFSERDDLMRTTTTTTTTSIHDHRLSVTYFLGRETVVPAPESGFLHRVLLEAYNFLVRNSRDYAAYFRIPPKELIEIGVRIVL